MTATPQLILWVTFNIIGVGVMVWLSSITWERKQAILDDRKTPVKKVLLRRVNKQLRNRLLGVFAHFAATIIGLMPMFGYRLPFDGNAWIAVTVVGIIVAFNAYDLYGEFNQK